MNLENRALLGHKHSRDRDRLVAQLSASQNGLISRAQAIARGFKPAAIHRRVDSGRWDQVYQGVYRLAGVPHNFEQDLLAACLWAGGDAVASHTAAAKIWKLDGITEHCVEITVPRACKKSASNVVVHRSLFITPRDRTVAKNGIPVTNLPRTLIDLASILTRAELELALEDALRRRLVSLEWMWKRVRMLRGQGRHGIAALEGLLENREPHKEMTDSALEMRVLQMIREAHLPEPICHHNVTDGARLVAEVDFAYPEKKIAIEADGRRYHDSARSWDRDRERLTNLAVMGWRVLHVKWSDVTSHRREMVERLSRAVRGRSSPAGLVSVPPRRRVGSVPERATS